MRKRVWIPSPIMNFMVILLYLFAIPTFRYHKIWFCVEITIATLMLAAVVLLSSRFYAHIWAGMKIAKKILSAKEEDNLNKLGISVCITGDGGDIIWANKQFIDLLNNGESPVGLSIQPFIHPCTLKQLKNGVGKDVAPGGKGFTVYNLRKDDFNIMYFIDDGYYKQIAKEYKERKSVIALIAFDNKEEILRNASGGDESRITAEVENVLREWASVKMGGLFRSLSGGRYMLITDEAHMELAKRRRFEILDKVHTIKGMNEMTCTISIGVGLAAPTTVLSEEWARNALDMALGRGGDQVAILSGGTNYEFFGGLSSGVEKQDKVRTRVMAETLAEQIKKSDKVFIMGHRNSDLDAIGAAVGMWAASSRGANKLTKIIVNRNLTTARALIDSVDKSPKHNNIFISPGEAIGEITQNSLLIVVDTHSPTFVESPECLEKAKNIAVIDHHRMMVTRIQNAVIFYVESYASSASEMVTELAQYMGNFKINNVEASALLAGIMLDTKNFVMKTGVRTFEASAFLRKRGADTVEVKKLFSNSLSLNKEKSLLVGSAEIYRGCAISYTETTTSETRVAAAQAADELLGLQGVAASFVLFRVGNEVNISGRSLGDVNVQLILEEFGGGGHLTMAGAQIRDITVEEARLALIDVLNKKLSQFENKDKRKTERI
jgi:cyclic-di-AMP phosphodiesterase